MAVNVSHLPIGEQPLVPDAEAQAGRRHPISTLVRRRLGWGVVTLLIVSILVFWATQVLPGNAAYAILGHEATPQRIHALEVHLHLKDGIISQYWRWLSGLLTGRLGTSLANGNSVWSNVNQRLVNSAVLVVVTSFIGTVLGIYAALRKGRFLDHLLSVSALGATALPEFVVAITVIILFSTVVFHVFPSVSLFAPGTYAWQDPKLLVLPVATLVIVIVPYLFRMTRAAMIEALESDYVEMARLKGVPSRRIVMKHALPNALPPIVQVMGLNLIYLAGGIVVVEYVFNFPGIGQGLIQAVEIRDIPVIQVIVMLLAAFYIVVNIVTDVVALLATPRRRLPRSK
jgi:peptide/nickel transport system permease protein